MISSRKIFASIATLLLVPVTLQAMQPVNLDDSAGTFSSIKISTYNPQKTLKSENRSFAPYIGTGFVSLLGGGFIGGFVGGIYYRYSNLPWWEADNTGYAIGKTIQATTLLLNLYITHTSITNKRNGEIEAENKYQKRFAPIKAKTHAIVGDSSFLDAIKTDNVEHMKAWLECDPFLLSTDTEDNNYRTPIMLATLASSTNVLKLFLEYYNKSTLFLTLNHQADKSHDGNTALHMAVENKNHEAAKLLLEYGADKSIKNYMGKTPADLIREDDKQMLQLFPEARVWSPAAASALGIHQEAPPAPVVLVPVKPQPSWTERIISFGIGFASFAAVYALLKVAS